MYSAVTLHEVTQRYGATPVLDRCSLQIVSGETYGLIGPTGAGKTTLLQVVLGWLLPEFGRVQVLGSAGVPADAARRIGYLPAGRPYLTYLTARQYLWNFARVSGLSVADANQRSSDILKLVGLHEVADRPLSAATVLQRQSFGLGQALLNDPDLVLIDEPFRGLDGYAAQDFLELLMQTRRRGQTVVIAARATTGLEQLCDRLGVLYNGALITEAPMTQLRGTPLLVRVRTTPLSPELQRMLRYLDQALQVGSQEILITQNSAELQPRLLRLLLDADVTILAVQPLETRLDRFYRQALRNEPPEATSVPPADGGSLLTSLLTTRDGEEESQL